MQLIEGDHNACTCKVAPHASRSRFSRRQHDWDDERHQSRAGCHRIRPGWKILHANENFLKTLGYSLEEIKGNHHSMFVDAAYRQSPDYRLFWEKLGRGEYDAGQYKRIGKGGRVVWIQASYNPVLDRNGKPFKVVKFATDITEQKLRNADYEGQIAAISKAQAVIEFTLDGKVIGANNNFLKVLGYSLGEIKGQHHAMFVEAGYRQSPEYRLFWEKLGHGEYEAGQYKRIGKGGTEVWIQASYNPIMDADGKPFKTFLRKIMALRPMPVVMISTLTQSGAETTLEALEIGAVDFIAKPELEQAERLADLAAELQQKVKAAAQVRVGVRRAVPPPAPRRE